MTALARFPAPAGGEVKHVKVADGLRLRVGVWRPSRPPLATVLLLGGRTEFIEKYHEVIGELLRRRYFVWTCDWRGQGLSDRVLANPHKGHVDDYQTFINDLRELLTVAMPGDAPAARIVLAHSMGGHIALRFAAEIPDQISGLVLSAPMIDIYLTGPSYLAARLIASGGTLLGLADKYALRAGDYDEKQARFQGNALTQDRRRFDNMVLWVRANPRLALGGPTIGWLAASLRSIALLRSAGFAESLHIPVLISSASQDMVVSNEAQQDFGRRLPNVQVVMVEGARHEVLMETDDKRQQFWAAFDEFAADVLG